MASGRMASEIDAAAVLLPVAETRRFGAIAATDFRRKLGALPLRQWFRIPARLGRGGALAYHLRLGIHPRMLNPAPMPFKIDTAPNALPRLTGFTILQAEGAEAGEFLQAQTMNDVRALARGQWQWNGWLNPKGRVIALFALWRVEDRRFLLLLPDFPAGELQPLLQRYVFRSKLQLTETKHLACAADFGTAPASGTNDRSIAKAVDGGAALDMSGTTVFRQLVILPDGHPALRDPDEHSDARWLALDIAHGLPRLPAQQRETWTPQMLALERLQAYSLKKGCYPGQEIVARTHYLGQAKRSLARLEGTAFRVGDSVQDGQGQALGELLCCSADGREALAVLASPGSETGWTCAGQNAHALPLLPGLNR